MLQINAIAAALLVIATVRALHLFHCRLGYAGRLATGALGFFAFAGLLSGDVLELRGVEQGIALSLGALAGVLLWKTRRLLPVCDRRAVDWRARSA